ncbi:SGNH/GDSL hydrolase family protein [Lacisediminihabitans changchengi]|uniref:SGNH/GDSL hydrolase family protein n=1 Tax=Lacisediminihabitans changchengi TaxID=2787634 RepID=A0A934SLE2_9MICO|nr:SGNH/GDSL hydrolase family protein [Lacisediminihabitans changchengi]MBK4348771.1 SGNH/GDSL hydrolase family protein [Lacisediminihabitans changchengi]
MSRAAIAIVAVIAVVLLVTVGAIVLTTSRSAPQPAAQANGTRVAFYGDSYTLGTGASARSKRWSTVICRERGWTEFNHSTNGLGFINNRAELRIDEPAQVIADKPDIVFITMGLNDNFSYDTSAKQIHAQIGTDFRRLKTALPDARFIVVEPFWYTDQRPTSLGVIIRWVKEAASDIDADYIPGASRWIEHHPEWMASDGLHPNDAGYAEMAKRMDMELSRLGL